MTSNWKCGGCNEEKKDMRYEVIRQARTGDWKKWYCCSAECLESLGIQEGIKQKEKELI